MKKSVMMLLAAALLLSAGAAGATPGAEGRGKKFSVMVNGGMSFLGGGDLNTMIGQMNLAVANLDDPDVTAAIDWREFKAVPRFGAEVLYHVSDRFALGLGFEFLTKTNIGDLTISQAWAYDYVYGDYTEHVEFDLAETFRPENTLSVVPLTLSAAYYIPVGRLGRAFVKAGIGYYMAKLKSSYAFEVENLYTIDEYYLGSLIDVYTEESVQTSLISDESKANAFGFHGGLGLEIDLSRALALVVEGGIRVATAKDWSGSGRQDSDYWIRYGWASSGMDEYSDSYSTDYEGSLVYLPDAVIEDGPLVLVENPDWSYEDSRPAKINLGGAGFRAGLMIRF